MKKNKLLKKMNNNALGITLIALVITIIVLLILAGVSISLVMGENGVLNKATTAANETEYAQEADRIDFAVASVTTDKTVNGDESNISVAELQQQVDADLGSGVVTISQGESEDVLLAVFHDGTNRKHYINANWGNPSNSADSVYWQQIIGEAKVHPDQPSIITDIGIGTDGKPVNLNNWKYHLQNGEIYLGEGFDDPYTYTVESYIGYIGKINSNGEIEGKVPQYIVIDGQAYPVVHLENTFKGITNLKKAPEIPSTVKTMEGTFSGCTGLTTVEKMPNSIESMQSTFANCASLVSTPTLPDSVKIMKSTFASCTKLTTITNFPHNLTSMDSTFRSCTKLTTVPKIPNTVTDMGSAFYNCTSLQTIPNLPTNLNTMGNIFNKCTNLTTVPEIPQGVEYINNAFAYCSNLRGTLVIKATNLRGTTLCFHDAATSGETLYITGTTDSILQSLLSTKTDASKIEILK